MHSSCMFGRDLTVSKTKDERKQLCIGSALYRLGSRSPAGIKKVYHKEGRPYCLGSVSARLYIGPALYQLGSVSVRLYILSALYWLGSILAQLSSALAPLYIYTLLAANTQPHLRILTCAYPPATCSLLWYIVMVLVMGLTSLICFSPASCSDRGCDRYARCLHSSLHVRIQAALAALIHGLDHAFFFCLPSDQQGS